MNQAVYAGQNLGKGTKGHQLHNLGIHHITNIVVGHELVPGVHLSGLIAQRDLVLLGVEGDNVDINLVTNLDDISGSLDPVPAQLGNVNHAINTANIHESAVRSQRLDNAMILLAVLNLSPDLLLSGLTGLRSNSADGADNTATSAVNLGNLHLYGLTNHASHIAALGNARLGSRNEHADALNISNQAALVFLGDGAFHGGLVLHPGSHVVPNLQTIQLLLGQLNSAFLVVHTNNEYFDLVANLQDILGLHRRIGADFVIRDVTGMLGAQINLDFGVADTGNGANDLISCI